MATDTFIREHDGTGDTNDITDWSAAEIDGEGCSRLVGGPG